MSEHPYEDILKEQFSKVMTICIEAKIKPRDDSRWLEIANELAELLIACPTEKDAKQLLLENRDKIQFFVLAANNLLKAVARFPVDRRTSGEKTPFYELCELMIQTFSQWDDEPTDSAQYDSTAGSTLVKEPSLSSFDPRAMEVLATSVDAEREVGYLDRVLFTRISGEEPTGEIDSENVDLRWPYPAVWIEGRSNNRYGREWGAIVEITSPSFPATLEESLWSAYATLNPESSDVSETEKEDRSTRIEEAMATGSIARYLQSVRIFGPLAEKGRYWGMIGHPLSSDGKIIPSLQVIHVDPQLQNDGVDETMLEILETIQCWAGWFNTQEEGVPGFRQYETIYPPTLQPNEIPPVWSRFFHQRFRRSRPYLKQIESLYAVTYGAIEMATMEKVSRIAAEDWNWELKKFERKARPRSMQAGFYESNHSHCYLSTRAQGNAIIRIPDSLVEEFYYTSVNEVCCSDIEWPYEAYYLSFNPPEPILLAPDFEVDGAYVVRQGNVEAGLEIFVLVTSRNQKIAYHRVPSYICAQDPVFAMHFPIEDVTTTIEDALEKGIAGFYEETEPPEKDESQVITKPDGAVAVIEDGRFKSRAKRREVFESQRASFDKALRVIINSMCFLGAYRTDAISSWEDAPAELVAKAETSPSSRRTQMASEAAKQRLEELGFVKIQIAGLKTAELLNQPRPVVSGDENQPVRPHWRRGHWRRQKHGAKLTMIRLMWIRPVLVNAKLGKPDTGHIYEAEDLR
jgi:hypothetical protein